MFAGAFVDLPITSAAMRDPAPCCPICGCHPVVGDAGAEVAAPRIAPEEGNDGDHFQVLYSEADESLRCFPPWVSRTWDE